MTDALTEEELDAIAACCAYTPETYDYRPGISAATMRRLVAAARQSIEAKEFLIRAADGDSDGTWMQEVRLWLDQNAPDWSNVVRVKP